MVKFAELFETPGFRFGEVISPPVRETEEGLEFTVPYSVHSPEAQQFIERSYRLGWVLQDFDWMAWSGSAEARQLQDDPSATLASAGPEQLAMLLTSLIRGDRFSETTLVEAFNSGLLTAIVKRMAALLNDASTAKNTQRRKPAAS